MLAVLVLLTAVSCDKINEVKENLFKGFDVALPGFNIQVPPIPLVTGNEISLGTYSFRYNLDSAVRANTSGVFGAGAVSSVRIKKIVVALSNPDGLNNLSNFDYTSIRFSSASKAPTDPPITITFPDVYTETHTQNISNSPDLKSFLNGEEVLFNLSGKNKKITTKPLSLSVEVTVTVK